MKTQNMAWIGVFIEDLFKISLVVLATNRSLRVGATPTHGRGLFAIPQEFIWNNGK